MQKKKSSLMACFALAVVLLCLALQKGEAATVRADCDAGGSITAGLSNVKPGDTLKVSGSCKENLIIPEEVQKITLDGEGKATIAGGDKTKDTILVYGTGVIIKGFTITGGRDGIHVLGGATALVDRNTIQNTGRFGIYVTQHSSARIVNSTIQNNGWNGVSVSGGSFAYIGFLAYLDLQDKAASPNTIQGNGRAGIHVHRTAYARIAGNTITNNKGHGIEVLAASHAQIGTNTIDGNAGDGVFVSQSSAVDLGSAKGSGILNLPNKSGSPNRGFGIRCTMGGSVGGRLETLNGSKGAKSFESGCSDGLVP